jgi:polyphosphate kinase
VLVFGPPGEEEYFLASADWMPRNLYRRVEVMFPVESERLREQIRHEVIEPALADNSHAYDMSTDGGYTRRSPPEGQQSRAAQAEVFDRAVRRALQLVSAG